VTEAELEGKIRQLVTSDAGWFDHRGHRAGPGRKGLAFCAVQNPSRPISLPSVAKELTCPLRSPDSRRQLEHGAAVTEDAHSARSL